MPGAVESAAIAPGGRWVFAGAAGRGGFLRNRGNRDLVDEPVAGLMEGADRVAWSADGTAAVLYSSSRGAIQRVSFRDGRGVAGEPLNFASPGERLTALAVEAGGKVAAGVGSGLYLLVPDALPIPLAGEGWFEAAAFSPDGRLLAAAESTSRLVSVFRGLPPVSETIRFADEPEPLGLAFSADGRRLAMADGVCGCLRIHDFAAGRVVSEIPLDARSTDLSPLNGGSLFLLRRWAPTLVLDFGLLPAVFFVPAPDPEAL
jgi:hypothetical protein